MSRTSERAIISMTSTRYRVTATSQPTSTRVAGRQVVATPRMTAHTMPRATDENRRGRDHTIRCGRKA
jgi:hypothetical protein